MDSNHRFPVAKEVNPVREPQPSRRRQKFVSKRQLNPFPSTGESRQISVHRTATVRAPRFLQSNETFASGGGLFANASIMPAALNAWTNNYDRREGRCLSPLGAKMTVARQARRRTGKSPQ
jgi:hypothetical protein